MISYFSGLCYSTESHPHVAEILKSWFQQHHEFEASIVNLKSWKYKIPCGVPCSEGQYRNRASLGDGQQKKNKEKLQQLQISSFVAALSQTMIRLCRKRLSNTSVLYSCFCWPWNKNKTPFSHTALLPQCSLPFLYLFVWSPHCAASAPSKSPHNLQLNLALSLEVSAGEITQLGLILSATEFGGSS